MSAERGGKKGQATFAIGRRLGLRCARFDFRGHGESHGTLYTVTMSDLLADVSAVVDHVGPSVLIGTSLGGLAAAWFAALRPDRVIALVLLAPALGYLPEMARRDSFELRGRDESVIRLAGDVLRDAARYDERELPGRIAVPTLVFHGSGDRTVRPELSDAFCRGLPHREKEFWLIAGGSHSLEEDTGPIFERVEAFLVNRGLA